MKSVQKNQRKSQLDGGDFKKNMRLKYKINNRLYR